MSPTEVQSEDWEIRQMWAQISTPPLTSCTALHKLLKLTLGLFVCEMGIMVLAYFIGLFQRLRDIMNIKYLEVYLGTVDTSKC